VTVPLPRVTVVIPVHVREDMLFEHSLPCALRQEEVDVSVTVVCDGSPDRLVRRIESFGDPRVTVIRHATARGVAQARNAALASAETEWVAILDDDDLWSPAKLARQVGAAERAGAGFAYSSAVIVDERLRVKSFTAAPDGDTLLVGLLARNTMPGGGSNILARTELLRDVGGFDSELVHMSDWDIALRLAVASTGAAVADPLVAWVRHEAATAPTLESARRDLDVLRARYADVAARHGVRIDEAATLVWVGSSELVTGRRGHRLRSARAFVLAARTSRRPGHLVGAGRALLGSRVNNAARERIRTRPRQPDWLAALASGPRVAIDAPAAHDSAAFGGRVS